VELGIKGRERIKPAELGVGVSTREAIDKVVALGEQHAARRLPFLPSLATPALPTHLIPTQPYHRPRKGRDDSEADSKML